jgi:GNAT superfamily N-acetyltransferase
VYIPIRDEEIPAIVALMNHAYRGSGASQWSNEPRYLAGDRTTSDALRADLAAKRAASLLKWVEDEAGPITGCVWLEPLGDDTWYLGSLAIEPDRQRGGLGRVMLSAAEQWVCDRGGKRMQMTVINVRDALIAWYVRRGYHKTGETAPFPYGDDRFGAPLRDDLCFVVLEKDLASSTTP